MVKVKAQMMTVLPQLLLLLLLLLTAMIVLLLLLLTIIITTHYGHCRPVQKLLVRHVFKNLMIHVKHSQRHDLQQCQPEQLMVAFKLPYFADVQNYFSFFFNIGFSMGCHVGLTQFLDVFNLFFQFLVCESGQSYYKKNNKFKNAFFNFSR